MKKLICALLAGLLSFTIAYKLSTFDPKEYVVTNSYTYTCQKLFCHVYLTSAINEESNYLGLYDLIANATPGKTIYLHLSGNGGHMSTVYHLVNAIEQSKAEVNTVIEGPVYSAHAMIAMFGHKIKIAPTSLFMFHVPAVQIVEGGDPILPAELCPVFEGHTDRGQDTVKKCEDGQAAEQALFNRLAKIYLEPFLTKEEIKAMYEGHDIYISGVEFNKRVNQ